MPSAPPSNVISLPDRNPIHDVVDHNQRTLITGDYRGNPATPHAKLSYCSKINGAMELWHDPNTDCITARLPDGSMASVAFNSGVRNGAGGYTVTHPLGSSVSRSSTLMHVLLARWHRTVGQLTNDKSTATMSNEELDALRNERKTIIHDVLDQAAHVIAGAIRSAARDRIMRWPEATISNALATLNVVGRMVTDDAGFNLSMDFVDVRKVPGGTKDVPPGDGPWIIDSSTRQAIMRRPDGEFVLVAIEPVEGAVAVG